MAEQPDRESVTGAQAADVAPRVLLIDDDEDDFLLAPGPMSRRQIGTTTSHRGCAIETLSSTLGFIPACMS
jgi:hypothetical protein